MKWVHARKTVIGGVPTELAQTSTLWASVANDVQACYEKGYVPSGGEVVPSGGDHPGGQPLYDPQGGTHSPVTEDEVKSVRRDQNDWETYRNNVEEAGSVSNAMYESQILDNVYKSRQKIRTWQDKVSAQGCKLSAPVTDPIKPSATPGIGGGWWDALKAWINPVGAATDNLAKIPLVVWIVGGIVVVVGGAAYLIGPQGLSGAFGKPTRRRLSK